MAGCRCAFHRVDPRLRVLKGVSFALGRSFVKVSSRRPEVEGTERGDGGLMARTVRMFHRVDPRLRVLKGL